MRSLIVCTTCRYSEENKFAPNGKTGGETLLAHLKDELAENCRKDVIVNGQSCLWNCKRPCSVVMKDSQRFSYVTGGHEPTRAQASAILEWFDLHARTATGEVPFRQWPDRIRGHFIARIPA